RKKKNAQKTLKERRASSAFFTPPNGLSICHNIIILGLSVWLKRFYLSTKRYVISIDSLKSKNAPKKKIFLWWEGQGLIIFLETCGPLTATQNFSQFKIYYTSKQFLEHCLSSSIAVLMVCLSNLEHAHERSRTCSIAHANALKQKICSIAALEQRH
ncbi:hypothetical protein BpHYR1_014169, partial [Brachionus plicatilis]